MNPDDITYHDFVIRFERRWRSRYPISIESRVANIQTDVRLPFVPEQIQTLQGRSEYLESGEERVAKDLGVNLFDALFADCRALRLFERNLGIVEPVSSKRLRLKLHFALGAPDLVTLNTVPWELLYDTVFLGLVGRSGRVSIVRFFGVSKPLYGTQPFPRLPRPMSVLMVLSCSKDGIETVLVEKARIIEGAMSDLRDSNLVALEILVCPTSEELRSRWSNRRYSVLHFVGHGGLNGEPALCFTDKSAKSRVVSAEALCGLLREQTDMQLVFLDICRTCNIPPQHDIVSLNTMAVALASLGLPAVLTMQFPIPDSLAIKFYHEFYERLAQGCSVDTAVADGRQALFARRLSSLEWAAPVLSMNAPDGRLFHSERGEVEPSQPPKYESDPRSPQYGPDTTKLKADILDILHQKLGQEELKTLCFKLGVEYDSLSGEGRVAKARELVAHISRRNRLDVLAEQVHNDWPDIAELEPIVAQLTSLRKVEGEYADTST